MKVLVTEIKIIEVGQMVNSWQGMICAGELVIARSKALPSISDVITWVNEKLAEDCTWITKGKS